jgi:TRAP-type C4-dicarboxylate transport system permease small subunit
MAGAGFLALAHTLKRGEHIRVTLVLGLFKGAARRGMEVFSLSLASLLACLFAFYSCRLVWQSIEFHDISTGNDATPLWIPQLAMALGTVIFALAFVDELVLEIRGQRASPESGEMLRNE